MPLSRDANSKEAAIIGSILMKLSLPVLHAAAALLKMTEFPYTLGTSYFIKVLLGKKYALPARVIVALVDYFYGFTKNELQMPVMWH